MRPSTCMVAIPRSARNDYNRPVPDSRSRSRFPTRSRSRFPIPASRCDWRDDLLGLFGELAWQARRTAGAIGRAIDRDPDSDRRLSRIRHGRPRARARARAAGRGRPSAAGRAIPVAQPHRVAPTNRERSTAVRARPRTTRRGRRDDARRRSSPTTKASFGTGSRRRVVDAAGLAHRDARPGRCA